MFDVSFNDKSAVFVNTKTNKAESIPLFKSMTTIDAIRALDKEAKAAESASRAAVSLLSVMLNNPRLDGYKGVTPIRENIPKELKAAVRELEVETLKPDFVKYHTDKGAKPATVEQLWQDYARDSLRAGGSYAVAKGKVLAYFAHCGKLPIVRYEEDGTPVCMTVAAIDKILQNEREKAAPAKREGIADKLVKLSEELRNYTEKTELGDYPTAIAALKYMLATYETMQNVANERATELKGNPSIMAQAAAATSKAKESAKDAETAPI